MEDKRILWGLSFGISFLGIAGVFWLGLAISSVMKPDSDWHLWLVLTFIQLAAIVCSVWAAIRLRRRSGFKRKDLRLLDEQKLKEVKLIRFKFLLTTLIQTILIIAVVLICNVMKRQDLIWILTSLIVSVHFIPLSKIFNVRVYCVTGLFGTLISLIALIGLLKSNTILLLGIGMCLIMWITAFYIFVNADRIASRAVNDNLTSATL